MAEGRATLNAGNDEPRTVWSRETGQAEGLCLNRDVLAGDDPPTTESYDDRVEDRFLEGDEWLLYLPFFFPLSEGWSSPLGSDGRVMALTDGTATNGRLQITANHQGCSLLVTTPSGTLAVNSVKQWGGPSMGDRGQWMYFWPRMKVSEDSANGWVQWGRGILENGVAQHQQSHGAPVGGAHPFRRRLPTASRGPAEFSGAVL